MKKYFLAAILYAASFASGPVSYYGELKIRLNTPFLESSKTGEVVMVRGVSFGWSNTNWESERFYTAKAVEYMANDWKAEVVRAAYGSTGTAFSNADAAANRERIETIVEAAIENDIYVIIDWHSHYAESQVEQATAFFEYMAEKYGDKPNVIFELYNEPLNISWSTIKTYAEKIIPVIREHSNNLILVGTPSWSQKVQDVIRNGINDPNIGYVLHFYAASHNVDTWRDNIINAMNDTLPIFVTEYGTTNADGGCSPKVGSCSPPDSVKVVRSGNAAVINWCSKINTPYYIYKRLDNSSSPYELIATETSSSCSESNASSCLSQCSYTVDETDETYQYHVSTVDNYDSHNAVRSDAWHAFMDQRRISSVAWNINDKYEGSAFFGTVQRGFDFEDESWGNTEKMTESGKYIFNKLNEYYLCVPWNEDRDQNTCSTSSIAKAPLTNSFNFELIGGSYLSVSLQQAGNVVLDVFSLQGKKMGSLLSGYINEGSLQISLENLNLKNGVYIFKLRQNGEIQTKSLKIVK